MRWPLLGLAVFALWACGAGTPPAGDHLVGSARDAPHRETPAPAIAWNADAKAFETPTLPAVARAGELVVVPIIERDGERGFPNLRIEVRDKSDTIVQTIQIVTSNEMAAPTNHVAERVQAANTELARLHDLHDLVTMKPLDVQPASDSGATHLAMGDGLDIDWGGDHLHVFRHNSDRAVVIREAKKWQAGLDDCKTCGACAYLSYLKAAFHAPEISVIVVELGYRSDRDSCGEPSDQQHVVTW
jgi:hypothetical protein